MAINTKPPEPASESECVLSRQIGVAIQTFRCCTLYIHINNFFCPRRFQRRPWIPCHACDTSRLVCVPWDWKKGTLKYLAVFFCHILFSFHSESICEQVRVYCSAFLTQKNAFLDALCLPMRNLLVQSCLTRGRPTAAAWEWKVPAIPGWFMEPNLAPNIYVKSLRGE